jgi:hypothetical protein
MSEARFPAARKRASDGQCRRGAAAAALTETRHEAQNVAFGTAGRRPSLQLNDLRGHFFTAKELDSCTRHLALSREV